MSAHDHQGPTWWDVGQRLAELRENGCAGIEVLLVAPAKRMSGTGWTAWGVLVRYPKGPTSPGSYHFARAYFGAGGQWKTAPAAVHKALLDLETERAQREEIAASQSRF